MDRVSRLLDVARRGELVEIFCERCGAALGRYEVQERDGFVHLYEAGGWSRALIPGRASRARGVRGPRTGRRRVLYEHHERATYLRWRCGCGADVRRRTDLIGALQVTFNRERGTFSLVV